jgi:glutathione S-transferase
MIDLYAWATPNNVKVPILLEELGLAYKRNDRPRPPAPPELHAPSPVQRCRHD